MTQSDGRKLTRYKVIRRLGRGGMGEVYLADDVQDGRKVALKMLSAAGMDDDALRRFKREIQLCSACQHPGIVRIYDFGVNGSQPYYVMEVLDGWSLDRCVHDGEPLEIGQAITVGIQVGEALAYLHGRGMLHRDIKPHNVFFDKSGQAKLVDFGLAWSSSATCITRTGQILGSPRYLSPEMVRGDELDERADLFQYGLVLYEILTGQHAFDAESAPAVMQKIAKEPVVPPRKLNPAVPPAVETVIDNLLAKDPADRYQSAGELVDDLKRVQRGEPVERRVAEVRRRRRRSGARSVSSTQAMTASAAARVMESRQGVRKLKTLLWGACLVVALALIGVVAWKLGDRARPPVARDMIIRPFAGGALLSWKTEAPAETWIGLRPTPPGGEPGAVAPGEDGRAPSGLRWTRSVEIEAKRDHELRISDLEGDRDYDLVVGSPDGPMGASWGFHCPARLRLEGPAVELPEPKAMILRWESNVAVTMKARIHWIEGREESVTVSARPATRHALTLATAGFDAFIARIVVEMEDVDGGKATETHVDVGGWAADLGRRVRETFASSAWKEFCRSRGRDDAWEMGQRLFRDRGILARWQPIAVEARRRMVEARGEARLRLHRWLLPLEEADEAVRVVCKRDAFGWSTAVDPFLSFPDYKSLDEGLRRQIRDAVRILNYVLVADPRMQVLPESWVPLLREGADDDGPPLRPDVLILDAPVSFALGKVDDARWAYLLVDSRGATSQQYLSAVVNDRLELIFLRGGDLDDRMVARFPADVLRRGENVVTLRLRRPAEGLEARPFVLRRVALTYR